MLWPIDWPCMSLMTPIFPDVFKWLTGRIIDAEICSEKLRVFFKKKLFFIYLLVIFYGSGY